MQNDIEKILERINRLEKFVFENPKGSIRKDFKEKTLPELIRNKEIKNGQDKVTVIVGYFEKIKKEEKITKKMILEGWKIGKFNGFYSDVLLQRAIKEGVVRDLRDGTYDLSQTGELFFENFNLKI